MAYIRNILLCKHFVRMTVSPASCSPICVEDMQMMLVNNAQRLISCQRHLMLLCHQRLYPLSACRAQTFKGCNGLATPLTACSTYSALCWPASCYASCRYALRPYHLLNCHCFVAMLLLSYAECDPQQALRHLMECRPFSIPSKPLDCSVEQLHSDTATQSSACCSP